MSASHIPNVAGIDPSSSGHAHTAAAPAAPPAAGRPLPADPPPGPDTPGADASPGPDAPADAAPPDRTAVVQDRLAGWISGLTTLHDLTERLTRTRTPDAALHEVLRAGATLVGAPRGLLVLEPADGLGPVTTAGLGLGHAELGQLETVPRAALAYGRLLDGLPEPAAGPDTAPTARPHPAHDEPPHAPGADLRPGPPDDAGPALGHPVAPADAELPAATGHPGVAEPDVLGTPGLDPRVREVATRLGYAASYAVPLDAAPVGRLGVAVWLYDEPAEPDDHRRHLLDLYRAYAAGHLARVLELHRQRQHAAAVAEGLLPHRLPRVPGIRLAVRHTTGPRGGGDWFDALPLPDGALGLAVGSVSGYGPDAVAAMGRLRASLRAYAVMEGEDPVAVLSDLELLLRLTEPDRSATVLFAFSEAPGGTAPGEPGGAVAAGPGGTFPRTLTLAGAGHCPPLLTGERRTEFVETTLSAPLTMLACWEAPSVEIAPAPGETLLLYSDGLLRRTGDSADHAFARLHAAAAGAPRAVRQDPEALVDHLLDRLLPRGLDDPASPEDVVLLAVHFEEGREEGRSA
ncbi:PP2C family protein-serine/threonine phosphatase [Streptomyces catenulae]|uniref:PP2C family protein-serine/threonine phosphatase n=1 Tax=Streptomyces catenulae TaxID=66875 RepID=A0ABV2Z1T9_9ACTN|nr:PP2C family protein-serine/threonine phosphatase [Streptomyces catenulae]